ncbi:MAG: universal stress protein [Nitriliruptoraceae bacterium]
MSGIVVGVDGSESAQQALRFAIEDAERRKTTVTAVHVYPPRHERSPHLDALSFVTTESTVQRVAEGDRTWRQERAAESRQAAERFLSDIVKHVAPKPPVEVRQVVVEDEHPARVLIDRSASAELLVVGARGRGGFRGLLLGSVSQQVAAHARCPVVVVRKGVRG